MPESKQPHENLENIINGILSLNNDSSHISHGKRQLETKRPYPDIWVNNVEAEDAEAAAERAAASVVDEEDQEDQQQGRLPEPAAQVDDEISQKVALWLHSLQLHGFSPMVLQKYMSAEIDEEDDETWWESGLVRVFQPYYDIQHDEIQEVSQGKINKDGDPTGTC